MRNRPSKVPNLPKTKPMTWRLRLVVIAAAWIILGYPNPTSMIVGAGFLIASRMVDRVHAGD